MIGFALCGSYCTHKKAIEELCGLLESGYEVLPIVSENVYATDTRFGRAEDRNRELRELCGRDVVHTVVDAEPLGPKISLEAMIICPCTGNTLAKLAQGISDTAVTMAAKAHLRSDRPLIIALASNDALSANLKNIANMLNRKHVYFVPMFEDDPEKKPHSLIADFSLTRQTLAKALEGKQIQKIFM